MTTVALLCVSYGPYHFARLNETHHHFQQFGWRACGMELARSEADYAWKTDVEQAECPFVSVSQKHLQDLKLTELVPALFEALHQVNPDVIAIMGYFHPAMLAALAWSRWHRKPTILLSATKEDDAPRRGWQEQIKQVLIGQYQAALVGGKPQKRYLVKLGMRPDSIFTGYNVVGNDVFHPDRLRSLPNPRKNPFFLAINRFIQKKNIPNLLKAYAGYVQQSNDPWDLVLCGDGELRPQIDQQIDALGLTHHVHLPGFLQQDELLPYLAHASCFIHASTQEQWGLVVNEAMAAGLPVLVSNRCGCYEDLVVEGVNGWGFDPDSVEQMQQLMSKVSSNEEQLRAMGHAALAHIQNFSPRYYAHGLHQAAEYALQQA
jgi:glycosyltransferase involved in cell wall biosynthesis